jgi:hypothetical protein
MTEADADARPTAGSDPGGRPPSRRLLRTGLGLLVAALAAVLLVRLSVHPVGRLVVVALSVALAAGTVALLSRTPAYGRWRVGRGSRVLTRPAERGTCLACGGDATGGRRRRFVREVVVLGVPLVLLDDGTNRYCPDCLALEDPTSDGTGPTAASADPRTAAGRRGRAREDDPDRASRDRHRR